MRNPPLNYLITIALGAVLWVITAVFYGGYFSEAIILAVSTPEDFLGSLRVFLATAAISGISSCIYWYLYGGKESTAGDLVKAKKVWWTLLTSQIIISVSVFFAFIYKNLSEGILTTDWLINYGLFSLHTWFFFWLCSYCFSPNNVKYIPLFK